MSGVALLGDDYARAGFGGKLSVGQRSALVVIDVVMAYLEPSSPLYAGVEDALAANVRLVSAARRSGIPVIFTNVAYQPGGMDGGQFFRKVPALKLFEAGSVLGAFPPELQPEHDELVITKQYPSAFFGTSLASTLHAKGVDTVVLGGFSTSGCVRASALDALSHGFAPFVVRQACGDRDPAPHEANLFDMQAKMAEVIEEAQALSLFEQHAR
jgi:maleamate amidohydrolase